MEQLLSYWPWFTFVIDVVLLLGEVGDDLGGSEYLRRIHGLKAGQPPRMDLAFANKLHDFLLEIIGNGWVKSAHDCSEGGLAVALAECCMSNGDAMIGAEIDLSQGSGRVDATLFGETQSRIVVSCTVDNVSKISGRVPVTVLGKTVGSALKIKTSRGGLSWDIARLRDVWWNAIGRLMET